MPDDPAESEPDGLAVRCPECDRKIQIGYEDCGHTVECPHCEEQFRAEPDRDGDDDYYDRRRRPQRYREEDKAEIRAAAQKAIRWPSQGLMWTGAICAVLSVIVGIGLTIAGVMSGNGGANQGWVLFIYAGYFGGFGSAYHILLAIAGFQMKKLRGKGWFIAGGALGIASVILCGIMFPSTWAAMGFGIAALVALNKREVQDAIALNDTKEF